MPSTILRRGCTSVDARLPAATAPRPDVLFVTDDHVLREVAARVLERDGYSIRTATHSGHALLAALTTHVDVLVAELSAPDMPGPLLAERIRREHPDMAVVYLTHAGTPDCLDNVLVCPFTRDDLIASLDAAVGLTAIAGR